MGADSGPDSPWKFQERIFLCHFQLLGVPGNPSQSLLIAEWPWSLIPPPSHGLLLSVSLLSSCFLLMLCLCLSEFLFYKHTSHWTRGHCNPAWPYLNEFYQQLPYFQIQSYAEALGGHEALGATVQSSTWCYDKDTALEAEMHVMIIESCIYQKL